MVKNSLGFSLIEVMLYCLIAALLTVLVGQFLSKSIVVLGNDVQRTAETMNMHTAFALIMRDIEDAHSAIDSFMAINDGELIFKTDAGSIGWKHNQKGLYRFSGSYDFKKRRWLTVHSTPVLSALSHFSYSLMQKMGHVKAVEITIATSENTKVRTQISLINGVIA